MSTRPNLVELNLEGTQFSEENFTENFKMDHYINNKLAFHNFLQLLSDLKNLKKLNISYNDLFPYSLTKKQFGNPQNKFQLYHPWRKAKIEKCATLLAKNFKGDFLDMTETNIGEIFIKKFAHELRNIPNNRGKIIDFSFNEIPIGVAAETVLSLTGKTIEFDFSKNGSGKSCYSNDDLKDYILEQVMGNVTLSEL